MMGAMRIVDFRCVCMLRRDMPSNGIECEQQQQHQKPTVTVAFNNSFFFSFLFLLNRIFAVLFVVCCACHTR